MSISIFSYNGQVSIGIAADAHLVPDPDADRRPSSRRSTTR